MAKKGQQPKEPLDLFEKDAPGAHIAMLLWKDRHENPEMSVTVTEADLRAFENCVEYLGIKPQVRVERPQGRPATPAIAAVPGTPTRPGRSAVPAQPAEPPRPFVVIQLTDEQGNAFRAIENNEQDRQRQENAERARRAKESGRVLANAMLADMARGTYSNSTINDAAQALLALCK